MKQLNIGSGSIDNADVEAIFPEDVFPVAVKIENLMPRRVIFPEISTEMAADEEKTVCIASLSVMRRFISSVTQIAQLNGYPLALSIKYAADDDIQTEDTDVPPVGTDVPPMGKEKAKVVKKGVAATESTQEGE